MYQILGSITCVLLFATAISCSSKPKKVGISTLASIEEQSIVAHEEPAQQSTQKPENVAGSTNESDAVTASQPVSIGGAFLYCLEEKKGPQAVALCRIEKEDVQIEPPMNWVLSFYSQTAQEKIVLESERLPAQESGFTWRISLDKARIENLVLEVFDTENGSSNISSAIKLDEKGQKPDKAPKVVP